MANFKNNICIVELKRFWLTYIRLNVLYQMLDPEFHWLRQIATTLRQFHWHFLDAIAKAKKLICESLAQNLMPVSLTKSF